SALSTSNERKSSTGNSILLPDDWLILVVIACTLIARVRALPSSSNTVIRVHMWIGIFYGPRLPTLHEYAFMIAPAMDGAPPARSHACPARWQTNYIHCCTPQARLHLTFWWVIRLAA